VEHAEFSRELWELIDDTRNQSPLCVAEKFEYFESEVNPKVDEKRIYINSWLLEWVRNSSVDVFALKQWVFHEYPKIPAREEDLEGGPWSKLALEFWKRDVMGVNPDAHYNANRLGAIDGNSGMLSFLFSAPFLFSKIRDFLSGKSSEGSAIIESTAEKKTSGTPNAQIAYTTDQVYTSRHILHFDKDP